MLTIDISTLSAPELKRLIEAARARGQDALAERLSAQLANARPPGGRPLPAYAPPPEASPFAATARRPARRSSKLGRSLAYASLFIIATGAVTIALTFDFSPAPTRPPVPPAQPRLQLAMSVAAPELQPQPVATVVTPISSPESVTAERKPNPCRSEPTPADRLVCGYPALAQRERALQWALERAIANGADPAAIQHDQATWKASRDGVSDWRQLATAYEDRIRELQAVPAAAEPLATP